MHVLGKRRSSHRDPGQRAQLVTHPGREHRHRETSIATVELGEEEEVQGCGSTPPMCLPVFSITWRRPAER